MRRRALFPALMMALIAVGFTGCGSDDDNGNAGEKDTGAKTVSGAAKALCQEYLTSCGTDGSNWSVENCVQINESALSSVSKECALATINYTYCVLGNLSGDFCEYYWDERDMTDAEAEKAAKACMSALMSQAESC